MNLRDWMDQECLEVKQLAGKLNVSRNSIHLWLSGKTTPLRVMRALIQKISKNQVTIGEWDEQKRIYNRPRGSKKNGMHSAQCMGDDTKTKPKSSKARK